jgi:hypothetical protein
VLVRAAPPVGADDADLPAAAARRAADGVLGEPEPVPYDRPGMVVDESEHVRPPAADLRTVQGVTGPQLVAAGGLEPAEDAVGAAGAGQARVDEVPVQRALGR